MKIIKGIEKIGEGKLGPKRGNSSMYAIQNLKILSHAPVGTQATQNSADGGTNPKHSSNMICTAKRLPPLRQNDVDECIGDGENGPMYAEHTPYKQVIYSFAPHRKKRAAQFVLRQKQKRVRHNKNGREASDTLTTCLTLVGT